MQQQMVVTLVKRPLLVLVDHCPPYTIIYYINNYK